MSGRGFTLDGAALESRVGALAHALLGQGLREGDRVAGWLPKSEVACLLPLAAARAGLVSVPVNPLLKRAQVAHILADSGARLLIGDEARLATFEDGDAAEARVIAESAFAGVVDALPPSTRDPAEVTQILYTSGSTGRPKGVVLTHRNLMLAAESVRRFLRLTADDRALAVLPLSFDYGQNGLFSAWMAGGAVVALDYLLPGDVVKAVAREGITVLAGVPPLWAQLARANWPDGAGAGLRRLTNSGGALPVPVVRALRDRFPQAELHLMYGLTEAFRSTSLDPALVDRHPTGVGTAIPFAEVLVVRPDGGECAAGEPGELVHCGPLVAQGYWRDPERTAERYRPAPPASRLGGTTVWSGDTLVRDSAGRLSFVARTDSMIKVAGTRVSPTEIEEAAVASGEVLDAVAFGVPDPDKGAVVRLVASGEGEGWPERLMTHLKRDTPAFMWPDRVVALPELPRSPQRQARPGGHRAGVRRVKPMGAVPAHWRTQDGALTLGGRPATEWADALGTPCFLYSAAAMTARVAELRAAMPPALEVHYAMKANPHPDVLAHVRPLVDGLDVASGGELAGALAAGFAGPAISFAGPGKREGEIAAGLAAGVTFNAESVAEVERILAPARSTGRPARVALRINPAFEIRGSGLHMGGRASPFGMDGADVPRALALLTGAEWAGFHVYAGSQALDAGAVAATQAATVALVAELSAAAGRAPPHVNLGGGFGIPYFPKERPLDVAEVGRALGEVLADRPSILHDTVFSIELGRWLVGEAGVYLTRVVDRKVSRDDTFLVTDGGLHHQLAATGNFGTVVRRNYPLALAHRVDAPDGEREEVTVVGCLCTPLDRLGDRVGLPPARVGDVIAVFMAGAYGATASPSAFLGHGAAVERVV